MGYRVAVIGATGAVGREILKILSERQFPIEEISALASPRSTGKEISFGDKQILKVHNLETFNFSGWDIVLSSAGATLSSIYAPKAAKAGCIVIDNTSQFRMDSDVPLIVPEINPGDLKKMKRNIVANPNCSTIQMVIALKPLHELFKIKRVVVSTYQATGGAGKKGMDELYNQTKASLIGERITRNHFTKQIAFNCIPHIDKFMDDGSTKEEWKMSAETRKILDPNISVFATCVRVPVFIGHGEAITVECEKPVDLTKARQALNKAKGVILYDERKDEGYITQIEAAGEDASYISRLRIDPTVPNGLGFWCVSDNLRKGAALNTVQIAEALVKTKVISN